MSDKQTTTGREVTFSGIGLHTGNASSVTFKPAPAGHGIKFSRTDLPGQPEIPANFGNVLGVIRGTTIGRGEEQRVHTVEHLLSALYGMGVDNLRVEINANEPPVADGSALAFIEMIRSAGIVELDAARKELVITQPLSFSPAEGVQYIALPHDGLRITCTIAYNHPLLRSQHASFDVTPGNYEREIASSRTFCFDYEIEALRNHGLARGGSLDNAIVVGEKKIHNPGPLRFDDEFVRHKLLDLLGDLALLGKRIKGHIIGIRCGHGHNIAFAKFLSQAANAPAAAPAAGADAPAEKKALTGLPGKGKIYDTVGIQAVIPHRYPFLMVDEVEIVEEAKRAVGRKNVSGNEPFFQGHFPGNPIMPGVLIIESMAQTACVMFLCRPDLLNKLAFFMGIDGVKFRKPVLPGDALILDVEVIHARRRTGKCHGVAYVNGEEVCCADFTFAIVDKSNQA